MQEKFQFELIFCLLKASLIFVPYDHNIKFIALTDHLNWNFKEEKRKVLLPLNGGRKKNYCHFN